jgi:hypothetical protein
MNWYINDTPVYTDKKNELSIKPQEGGGQSKIKVEVSNFNTLFQEAIKTVFVNY